MFSRALRYILNRLFELLLAIALPWTSEGNYFWQVGVAFCALVCQVSLLCFHWCKRKSPVKSAEDVAYRSLNYGMRASWHTGTNAALARREEVEKLESVPFSADVLKYGLQSILLLFFLPVLLTSKRQSSWWKTFSADACGVLAATLLFARPVFQLFLDFLARPKAVELQRRVCSRWFDP